MRHSFIKNLRHIYTYIPVIACLVFFGILFIGSRIHSQSIYFQDETDHVAMGWMMVKFDKELYLDLSTNHQPIPVLFGAFLSAIIRYETLFELIENIRFSMFVFSAITSILLTIRFGWRGAIASGLTYSLSWVYFGWYVLAESVVIPAVIFMLLLVLEKLLPLKAAAKDKNQTISLLLFGFAAFWTAFSLLPLLPFVVLLTIWLLMQLSQKEKMIVIISGLGCTAILATVVHPVAWFEETISNNWKYFLVDQPAMTVKRALEFILYPVQGITNLQNNQARNLLIVALIGIGSVTMLLIKSLITKKQLLATSGIFLLVTLANLRVTENPAAFYSGFHLFPYVAVLFAFISHLSVYTLQKIGYGKTELAFLALVVVFVLSQNSKWVWEKKNKLDEYYIQYGWQESYGTAMKMIANPGDTLLSAPNGHGYMNMVAGLPIAGRQLFHLPWAYNSPKLRAEFQALISTNAPTFIYLEENSSGYHTELMKILQSSYRAIWHNDNPTQLYIHQDRAEALSSEDLKKLEEFSYKIASKELTKALLSGELNKE